jgi:hypothetical protein
MVGSRRTRTFLVFGLLAAAAGVVMWSSQKGTDRAVKQPAAEAPAQLTERQIYLGLCGADAADDRGDIRGARDQFVDVHTVLHDLAQATTARDRAAGAALLETKESVESAFDDGQDVDFDGLLAAARRAVEIVTSEDPGECGS